MIEYSPDSVVSIKRHPLLLKILHFGKAESIVELSSGDRVSINNALLEPVRLNSKILKSLGFEEGEVFGDHVFDLDGVKLKESATSIVLENKIIKEIEKEKICFHRVYTTNPEFSDQKFEYIHQVQAFFRNVSIKMNELSALVAELDMLED